MTGFAYAAAVYREGGLARYGVQAPGRIRQLHLDLIMMGGMVTATSAAVPGLPRAVVVPLATGCWTNALAFAPPAFYPAIEKSRVFRALVGVSFVTTAGSWVAAAVVANRRRRRGSASRQG